MLAHKVRTLFFIKQEDGIMKTGEFAKACGIAESALRYYDKQGLLSPIYTDRFTGYRYYRAEQAEVCKRIGTLKAAGFSLAEIKKLLRADDRETVSEIFAAKKQALEMTLHSLAETEKIMLEVDLMKQNESVNIKTVRENVNLPFENDEAVVGRWEIISEDEACPNLGGKRRQIFFLPNGEWYWCYSWTKGKFLFDDGVNAYASDYVTERREDGLYMRIELKSYDYAESGKTESIVLKKLDGKRYTKEEIARKDDIDMPFEEDERVIGKWTVFDFLRRKEDFSADSPNADSSKLYFKEIEFFPGGCVSLYGNETVSGDDMQVWTKGYVLRKWNSSACAYEIRRANGRDFLIIEWKSGDYRWGGFDTNYYVFVREQ